VPHDGCRQYGEAAHSGKNKYPSLTRLPIELGNTLDEFCTVGEVEVVDLRCETGFDESVRFLAITLKRTGRIYH
jgi:hypothetical protein